MDFLQKYPLTALDPSTRDEYVFVYRFSRPSVHKTKFVNI